METYHPHHHYHYHDSHADSFAAESSDDSQNSDSPSKRRRDKSGNRVSSSSSASSANKNSESTGGNVPVFLRKTFTMISSCNEDIAGWSSDGKSFIIKDLEKFGSKVIPEFFKHNNISSFIRQLNFYGFRKVRSNALRLSDLRETEEARYCKFAHEKFQRGRPDLLCEIKKPPPTVSHNAEQKEVEALKEEIRELEERVSNMSVNLDGLKASVGIMVEQNQNQLHTHPATTTIDGVVDSTTSFYDSNFLMSSSEANNGNVGYEIDMEDLLYRPSIAPFDGEDDYDNVSPYVPGTLRPAAKPQNRGESFGGLSMFSLEGDEDLDFWNDANAYVNDICDGVDQGTPMHNGHHYMEQTQVPLSSSPHFIPQQRRNSRQLHLGAQQRHHHHEQQPQQQGYTHPSYQHQTSLKKNQRYSSCNVKREVKNENFSNNIYPNSSNVDQAALDRLCSAVAQMPPNVRDVLTDHMLRVLTDPIRYQNQVDDLTHLAVEASSYSQRNGPKVDYEVVPLAVESAILGAYLDRSAD